MSETKHTPGPWQVGEIISPRERSIAISGSDGIMMASVFGANAQDDARLIAAARELLGACELDSGFESDGPALLDHAAYELGQRAPDLQLLVDELRRKAALERTAIAKVHGES